MMTENYDSDPTISYADLHIHSYFSDGFLSPTQIVEYAAKSGLRAISLTDHDTVEGLDEAMAAGGVFNVEVITGIELSATIDDRDIHILGYLFNHHDENFRKQVDLYKRERVNRAEKIVQKLNNFGVHVDMDQVMARAGKGAVGRPHIADAVVLAGFAKDTNSVFRDFLGYGGSAYEDKYKISPEVAIRLICDAGGVSFLAHPSFGMKQKYLQQLISSGVSGIECTHPKHTPEASLYFQNIVQRHHLLQSGGSDCHARDGNIFIGKFPVHYSMIEKMKLQAAYNSNA
ncbi:PHP domain-containing protein [bacterium]|nr:PHP domain-containing protein [bacterium]